MVKNLKDSKEIQDVLTKTHQHTSWETTSH